MGPSAMARLARVVLPGFAHHVTQAGVRGLPVFADDDDRRAYVAILAELTERHGVEVLAYCLMDSSVHLVAVPATERGLARAIGEAHRRYTTAFNARQGARGFLFQGRFGSCPLDEHHQLVATCCVEREPVRAGRVRLAADYPWSSARFHAGVVDTDPLVRRRIVAPEEARALLERDPPELAELLARARTGRPCGCESFIDQAEALAARPLRPGRPGRPRKQAPVHRGGRRKERS